MSESQLYIISYDLQKPRKDYPKLWDALKAIGADRVLESQWAVRKDGTDPSDLRDHFKQFIDSDDRLLITRVDDWATRKALIDLNEI